MGVSYWHCDVGNSENVWFIGDVVGGSIGEDAFSHLKGELKLSRTGKHGVMEKGKG